MNPRVTYAALPLPRRSRRARTLCMRVGLVVVTLYAARSLYTRARTLETDPDIGPVAWSQVLKSPTLLRTAWVLSGDPRLVSDPATFGMEPGKMVLSIDHPPAYHRGQVQFDLTIHNRGPHVVVLPVLNTTRTIQGPEDCMYGFVVAGGAPALASGLRLLRPGGSVTVPLQFSAGELASSTDIAVGLPSGIWFFSIQASGGLSNERPCQKWPELSPRQITLRKIESAATPNQDCAIEK